MNLYLIRHGEAADRSIDSERPLNDLGQLHVLQGARMLQNARIAIPAVWHSNKTRAVQTATIVAQHVNGNLSEHVELNPEADPERIYKKVQREKNDVALVGHLPHLSLLAAQLLHAKRHSEPAILVPAAILALTDRDGEWRIRWMIAPEIFAL